MMNDLQLILFKTPNLFEYNEWPEVGSQKLRGHPRNFCDPPLLNTITQGRFTFKKKFNLQITTKCFSNLHTNFGARRSRRLGVRFDKLGSAIFLVTLACLDISSKKRCL